MQRCLALVIVLLALGFPQVFCGYESLSYIVRRLNETEKCFNATVEHPSKFDECPLPNYPLVNKDYSTAQMEVPNIKLAINKLPQECYRVVLKTICIMAVEICTADRYSVGMFGYDVCVEYLECAKAQFGDVFLQTICGFLIEDYTNQVYNGTDPPIYFVIEQKKETKSQASSVYKTLILHIVLMVMVLQVLA